MTATTDAPASAPASAGDEPAPAPAAGATGWRAEALLLVEVTALTSFAFSRPVLDSFGRSPETFIARDADVAAIVWFGLIVTFVPALALGGLAAATRVLGPSHRHRAHVGLVAVLGGVVVWRLGQDATGWPGDATKLILAGLLAAPLVGFVRWRLSALATFLRYAGVASLLFLGQFLFTSPSAGLVLGDGPELDDEVAATVAAQLGDDPPDVVVVLFDALPTTSLLDGSGHIDAATYPNFARLADVGTWYRNNTANAIYTGYSVPAILTGRLPETEPGTRARPDPENLFTLLGGSYDVQAAEQVTNLCPDDVCMPTARPGVGPLLGDAVDLWWEGTVQADDEGGSDVPGALERDRHSRAERWIAGIEGRGDRPRLLFQHILLPHGPFVVTDDGTPYVGLSDQATGLFGPIWAPGGAAVGRQRHLLQTEAADGLLGQILDRLDADDAFDDTLVVVTADHGEAFLPGEPDRQLSDANADAIAWTPLLVKAPGQTDGRIDDANVQSVDIVPTVADLLGVDLPWDVDGIPAGSASTERDDDTKPIADYNRGELSDAGELAHVELDGPVHFAEVLTADAVEHDGPGGAWRRTAHGALVGRDVDDVDVATPGGAPGGAPGDEERRVSVERLADLTGGGGDRRLIEVVGHTELPDGTVIAYALDGTIAALTTVGPGTRPDSNMAHALLPPALFGDGGLELTAYIVTGDVGREVLTAVAVGPS